MIKIPVKKIEQMLDRREKALDKGMKGHICNDGDYYKHSKKSCLSCGGWDGVKGRGN